MKIIFDIGANKGQNFNYFFDKADIVIAFEANKNLVKKIERKRLGNVQRLHQNKINSKSCILNSTAPNPNFKPVFKSYL